MKIYKKFEKYINGIFDDKNEVILFYKKNNPKSLPLQINKLLSFKEYNSKYIPLHGKISKSYQRISMKTERASRRQSRMKLEVEDLFSKLFINFKKIISDSFCFYF